MYYCNSIMALVAATSLAQSAAASNAPQNLRHRRTSSNVWSGGPGCPAPYTMKPYFPLEIISYNGSVYQCKEAHANLWCGMWGYKPSEGTNWKLAWNALGTCDGIIAPTSSPNYETLEYLGGCAGVGTWQHGIHTSYEEGDRVAKEGKVFACKAPHNGHHCSQQGYEPLTNPATPGAWMDAWELVGYCQDGGDITPTTGTLTPKPTMAPSNKPVTVGNGVTHSPSCDTPTKPPTSPPTLRPTTNPPTDGSPTPMPTKSPSKSPICHTPTEMPTKGPTPSPSCHTPTTRPTTKDPTPSPICHTPTENPTKSPTASPSASPTTSPTASPTLMPTKNPTPSPSCSTPPPTAPPTKSPTASPTASPTVSPTQSPTKSPTAGPTASPTVSPTVSPTPSPTVPPTEPPTISPTTMPTKSPTLSPICHTPPPTTSQPTKSPICHTPPPTTSPPTTNPPTKSPICNTSPPTTLMPTKSPSLSPICHTTPPPTTPQPSKSPICHTPTPVPTQPPTKTPICHTGPPTPMPTQIPTQSPTCHTSPTSLHTPIPTKLPTSPPISNIPGGSLRWYVRWGTETCIQDCPVGNGGACGGYVATWDNLYNTAAECCQVKLPHKHPGWCKANSEALTSYPGSGMWYTDTKSGTSKCVQDCSPGVSAVCGGIIADSWVPLFNTAGTCCQQTLGWVNSNLCLSTSMGMPQQGSNQWYVDHGIQKCVQDCVSGPSCGGFKETWETPHPSKTACCGNYPWYANC